MKHITLIFFLGIFLTIGGCKKDPEITEEKTGEEPVLTKYELQIPTKYQRGYPIPNLPDDNPLTVEGISLGRMLFYDPILSDDSSQSCATCHKIENGFSDPDRVSTGINGNEGRRNAMAIINLAWGERFFWDGRVGSLEEQALNPVPDPIEMHQEWIYVLDKLQWHTVYPEKFEEVFGVNIIAPSHVVKAIAQFERSLISFNSRADRGQLNAQEKRGDSIFNSEKGDCFHCHIPPMLFTDNSFKNNGLDARYDGDKGLFEVTGNQRDIGKFKVPTLRNIELTAPYMHDGRFKTLEEVVDFYSEGLAFHPNTDPLMKKVLQGGLRLTDQEKEDLVAFLKTLTDTSFINNPDFKDPFK
ncbi:MAG: cytochrome c peroxidase [Bacteroidia bacterium]